MDKSSRQHSLSGDHIVTQCDLPILSWNIHDSITSKEGPKTNDPDFIQVLTQSMIFCLQETKQEVTLQNYECFNSTRPDSRSGGVCIGVHRSLSKEVKLLETDCPDFQALTVYPNDEKSKFTIINIYDSPEQSSYKAKCKGEYSCGTQRMTTLEQLLEFKSKNPRIGEIILVGDLNARTGNLNYDPDDEENDDDPEGVPSSHPIEGNRSSQDRVVNGRGALLLDFLACCKLSILNGCSLGDILGEFTSVNYHGASVVDYMAATPNLLDSIKSFQVLDLTKFSDHKPILCKLDQQSNLTDPEVLLESLVDVPKSYKWTDNDDQLQSRFLVTQDSLEFKTQI